MNMNAKAIVKNASSMTARWFGIAKAETKRYYRATQEVVVEVGPGVWNMVRVLNGVQALLNVALVPSKKMVRQSLVSILVVEGLTLLVRIVNRVREDGKVTDEDRAQAIPAKFRLIEVKA